MDKLTYVKPSSETNSDLDKRTLPSYPLDHGREKFQSANIELMKCSTAGISLTGSNALYFLFLNSTPIP